MNIVYVANDRYAQHLAVSMYSLLDTNMSARSIDIYVISTGIGEDSHGRLESIASEFGRGLHILDLSDKRERFGYETHSGRFDISAMGRFFLGDILPEADRYLYLDCDTVVCASLERLYAKDLRGCICGAVMEPTIYPQTKAMIGLAAEDMYFNSGLLLIDMRAWRTAGIDAALREYYRGIDGQSAFCDQDAINAVLKGRIMPLPPRYNFFSNYYYYSYDALVRLDRNYAGFPERAFNRAKAHPTIVHYAGDERPWIRGSRNPYGHLYREYLALTPWAGTPQEAGREGYMLAYHAMNLATRVAPGVRRVISAGYARKLYGKQQVRRQSESEEANSRRQKQVRESETASDGLRASPTENRI